MWHNIVKFWLSFTRREQLAILILSAIILVVVSIRFFASQFVAPPPSDLSKALLLASKTLPNEPVDTTGNFRNEIENQVSDHRAALTPFPFDPNTAGADSLSALGLKPGQVRNVLNYRARGGRFRTAEDFGKLFSISEQEFAQLAPYIRISGGMTPQTREKDQASVITDPAPVKPSLTIVELNEADSVALAALPGSGPWTAHRIVRYRQSLGGYVEFEQLLEVKGIDSLKFAAMRPWLTLNSNNIRPLRINYLDFRELIRHPYLNFEQVKAIVNHRDRRGFIRNTEELRGMPQFESEDIARLQPYLKFD
ncbi:MAG: helix-hairpin-helix domain-containing protein [Bacteroidetes bacterium]|nr:helix-hairpin-helix domain-containing protein [Bacteroidota bacterium]